MKKIVIVLLVVLSCNEVFADEIFITKRSDADNTIFDGKWTFLQEWKSTSEDKISFEDDKYFVVKTGHDYQNIYVLVDFVSDTKNDTNLDRGVICFDAGNEKNKNPDENDYCFWVTVGSNQPITISGDSDFSSVGNWKNIPNNPSLIAVGGVSDDNDRYTKIPHLTYEFKIPIDQIGKTNVYGFFVGIYEGSSGKWYNWPINTTSTHYPFIPTPNYWGELVSPDKSLPEFSFSMLFVMLLPSMLAVYFIIRLKYFKNIF